ncbi:MFS transporter [Micromonospora soli]|uniref:MFS transporter n=1 Tax=Micromonospora sp. NBRC 110009 TaxID=3061627 RepID=UPI002673C4E7|nr:MFS transporter [Micromonospora sp. NBRC 110009]WKT98697.1 MFS transporter [Micromonospora sp. NBRC 110009]
MAAPSSHVAGFASSIFLPLTGYLVDQHGWRDALLVLAAVHGLTTVPLHALVLRQPRLATTSDSRAQLPRLQLRVVLRDRGFWLLATAFTAHAAAIATFTIYLVAALTSWGHSVALAAAIAGLLGVLSVTGRLVTTALQRRGSTTTIAAAVFALQALAAFLLPWRQRQRPARAQAAARAARQGPP